MRHKARSGARSKGIVNAKISQLQRIFLPLLPSGALKYTASSQGTPEGSSRECYCYECGANKVGYDLEVAKSGLVSNRDITTASGYFAELTGVLQRLPFSTVDQISAALLDAYREGRSVFVFGNGGSAALASHFAVDLGKGATNGGKRFRVLALTDNVPMITAWANDFQYEDIFAEQLRNFMQPGDIAFAVSGSGNSPNVLKALQLALQTRLFTIGLTGFDGGKMKHLCNLCLIVPSDNMQMIEDLHVSVTHSIFTALRTRISCFASAAAAQ